jgi:hypothetical protein
MLRLLAAILALALTAMAEEKIWSALVLASDPEPGKKAKDAPAELAPYARKLAAALNYSQFEILGSATKAIGEKGQERWLVPSPTFMVGAEAAKVGAEYKIKLELFHERRRLLQTQAMLGLQSPLFISGPKHERGQLIVVFEIRP